MSTALLPVSGSVEDRNGTSDIDRNVRELFAAAAACPDGDPQRRKLLDEVCRSCLPLAVHLARKFRDRGVPLDDLEQVAALGLVSAVNRFDPSKGVDFVAYAIPTITGEIRRYFRDHAWALRVPRSLKDRHLEARSRWMSLEQELGRVPTADEVAESMGISAAELREAEAAADSYRCASLDAPAGDEGRSGLEAYGGPDAELERSEIRHTLCRMFGSLSERQRTVLWLRFFEEMTQERIARRIGVSQMQVSRILSTTLAQLRGMQPEDAVAA